MGEWINCTEELPPDLLVVMTKSQGWHATENVQMMRMGGSWWARVEDDSVTEARTPTHWRPIEVQIITYTEFGTAVEP